MSTFFSIQESCGKTHFMPGGPHHQVPKEKTCPQLLCSFHEQANFFVAKGLLTATLLKGSTLLHKQCTLYVSVQQQVTFKSFHQYSIHICFMVFFMALEIFVTTIACRPTIFFAVKRRVLPLILISYLVFVYGRNTLQALQICPFTSVP